MSHEQSVSLARALQDKAASYFDRDFATCRKKFREAYDNYAGLKQQQFYPLTSDVPELGTDIVYLGDRAADTVFVLISGTHGVEGYCGSAIQRFLLEQLGAIALPENTAILMVHSLNPWGMHWARRCDEAGIDLNRNFIDFTKPEALPTEYDDVVQTLLNSSDRYQEMRLQSEKYGQAEFDRIFSGGQYVYSWAPFFGGKEPAHGRRVIEHLIKEYGLAERQTLVIDLHTGLGPWSFGELISDHPVDSAGNQQAKRYFGAAIANAHEGASFSVPKSGLMDYCFHQIMQEQGFFLTLEFGSYGTAELFEVLLSEHVFWKESPPAAFQDPQYQFHRQRMIEHFCPNDLIWQQAVLFKAWQVFSRVLTVLTTQQSR
jgi:predicted deacylase